MKQKILAILVVGCLLSGCDTGNSSNNSTGPSNNPPISGGTSSSIENIYDVDEDGYIVYNRAAFVEKDAVTYYSSIDGLSGNALRKGLYTLIRGHDTIGYDGVSANWKTIYKYIDQDPQDASGINMTYSGVMLNNTAFDREHIWPKSIGFSDYKKLEPGYDLHNLHPALSGINSYRNNMEFGDLDDGSLNEYYGYTFKKDVPIFEPMDAFKGDIARTLFYMAIRYEGKEKIDGVAREIPDLELCEETGRGNVDGKWFLGNLSTLLAWNEADPVDQGEVLRNGRIYLEYQHNRNPFIDHPEYARMIFDAAYSGSGATTDNPTSLQDDLPFPLNSGKGGIIAGTPTSTSVFTDTVSGLSGTAYTKDAGLTVSGNAFYASYARKSGAFTLGHNTAADRLDAKYYNANANLTENSNASTLAMNFDVADSNGVLINVAEFYPSSAPNFLKDFKGWYIMQSLDGGLTYTTIKSGNLLDVERFQIAYLGETVASARYTLVIEGNAPRFNVVRLMTLKNAVAAQ